MQCMMARVGAILSLFAVAVVGQLSLGLRGESHTALAQTRISDTVVSGSSGPAGSVGGIALNQADTSGSKVYGVSTTDGQVFVLDTATGQTLGAWGIEKGILTPDDLVVSSNGTIYYTDTLGGFVGRIVPDLDPGPPDNTVMTRLNNPQTQPLFLVNSIALSDDETHLYAGVCFFEGVPNLIYDFNLTTSPLTITPLADQNNIPITFGAGCSLNGMDYRAGYLYGPQITTGDIFRVGPLDTPGQAPGKTLVSAGAANRGQCPRQRRTLVNPSSAKLDSAGRLYVIDAATNQLSVIDNPAETCQTPKKLLSLPGPGAVGGLAVDRNNGTRVFASSSADGYIVQVSPEDQEVQGYVKTSGLVLPLGLTATVGNQIFLGDYSTLRVVDTRRNRVRASVTQTITGFLDGTGVAAPFTVAPFGQHLVLSDWLDRLIQVYDPVNHVALANINTRFLGFGSPLNAIEYRSETGDPPSILAAHYVAPTASTPNPTSRLVKYSGPGFATRTMLGGPYVFKQFTGLATDGTSYWVADALGGAIHRFDDAGLGPVVANGLSNPRGLAAYNGRLYVIEMGSFFSPVQQLTSIDLSTGSKTVIEANIQARPASLAVGDNLVPGVAVDPETGDLYYSATGDRTLRRIPRAVVSALEFATTP